MDYHVLIAEDESVTREAIHQSLEILLPSARFLLAGDGGQAVMQSEENGALHLAFLDIKMPVMDGIEAARRIHARYPNCQIIFLTAFSDFSFMRDALNLGAVDYLLKPFSQTALAAALQKALNRLSFFESEQQISSRFQSQIQKLTQWVDDQVLVNVISGQQSAEHILQQFQRIGLAFRSGVFAAVRCPQGISARRVCGMLRGNDWGREVRLFFYTEGDLVLLLSVSPLVMNDAKEIAQRMERFRVKTEKLMRWRLLCAVGQPFHHIEQAQSACLLCFYELTHCTADIPFRRVSFREPLPDIPAFITEEQRSAEIGERLCCFVDLLLLQRLRLDVSGHALLRLWAHIAAALIPTEAEALKEQFQARIAACQTAETLRDCCADMALSLSCAPISPPAADCEDPRIVIEQYLNAHYHENLTLDGVAAEMQYAPTYFSKLFKKLFGQTMTAYLTALRLDNAKKLLRSSRDGVKEIALSVGFRDAAYFTSIFRREIGLTPSEYRAGATGEVRP